MAIAKAQYSSSQSSATLIAGVEDKIILIVRLLYTSMPATNFKLQSDPGGASDTDLTPLWFVAAGKPLDLNLGRGNGLAAERGKALGLTTSSTGPDQRHSITIWYELVS